MAADEEGAGGKPEAEDEGAADYLRSSYRELILEHLLLGQLLQHLWNDGRQHAEVLKSAVDDSGYDLVLDVGGVTRYIQLKSMRSDAKARSFSVSRDLLRKPGGCVVVMVVREDLAFDHFRFAETRGVDPAALRVTKHTKANAQGVKAERPNHRILPLTRFSRVGTVAELAHCLFGAPNCPPAI